MNKRMKQQPIDNLLYIEGGVYTWADMAEELKSRLGLLDILDIEFDDHEEPSCAFVWITYIDAIGDLAIDEETSIQIVYKSRINVIAKWSLSYNDHDGLFNMTGNRILKTRQQMRATVTLMQDGDLLDDTRVDDFQSKL